MAFRLGNGKLRKDQTDHYGRVKGSGGGDNSYASLTKVTDFTYQVTYNDIDYQKALAYFQKYKPNFLTRVGKPNKKKIGLCSAFSYSNYACRTFDWLYSNMAEFVVHTPSINDRKAVIGVGNMEKLTASIVESRAYSNLYDILPFNLADGINESGLFIASLVVPNDKGVTRGTTPTSTLEIELPTLMIPRFGLDNFSSVIDLKEYLEEHASIYNVTPLINSGYELHFFVKDSTGECGVIEFVEGALAYTQCEKATNFYINGVDFNDDGSVYTPATQDTEHDAITTNLITQYGSGLERYNIINAELPNVTSIEDLPDILQALIYTKTYDRNTDPFWYTEYVGGAYLCNTDPKTFDDKEGPVDKAIYDFDHRSRSNPITWQTLHGGIYDLDNKTMYLIFQEDLSETFTFKLKTSKAGGGASIDDFVTSEDIIFSTSGDKIEATFNKGPRDVIDNAITKENLDDSEEIVKDIDDETGKVSLYLNNNVSNKVNNSLQLPLATPSSIELVGIDSNKNQARISIDNNTLAFSGPTLTLRVDVIELGSGNTGQLSSSELDTLNTNRLFGKLYITKIDLATGDRIVFRRTRRNTSNKLDTFNAVEIINNTVKVHAINVDYSTGAWTYTSL